MNVNIIGNGDTPPRNDLDVDIPTTSNNEPGLPSVKLPPLPAAKSVKHKQYRQLVNRSKLKLMNSVFHNEYYFKAKTRLQRRKLGMLKDKQKVSAVGFKLMDGNLLKEVLAKSCICKFCKKSQGNNKYSRRYG